ncbi:hypothetical protein FRC03_012183 [Tulasnella sp. 419]|nr:hypothetical protein FRC03_012183 [Tulasnella sp. 419]
MNQPTTTTLHINPGMAVIEAVALGPVWNEGWRLSHSGDYRAAEHILQLVLDKRAGAFGPNSTEVARTKHALREQQLRLGKLAEAEANLKGSKLSSIRIRRRGK